MIVGFLATCLTHNTLEIGVYVIFYLIFKNRASYIQDGHTATLQMLHFIYFFQQI
jgi:hypothetical protein